MSVMKITLSGARAARGKSVWYFYFSLRDAFGFDWEGSNGGSEKYIS